MSGGNVWGKMSGGMSGWKYMNMGKNCRLGMSRGKCLDGGGVVGKRYFWRGEKCWDSENQFSFIRRKKKLCTLANVNSAENISVNYTLCVKSGKSINKISLKKYVYKLYIIYMLMSMLEILKT